MFHRRLILLIAFFTIAGSVLMARVARLTIVDGAALLREAERRLVSERWIETTRGRILDRAGRVLAMDRPAFDVAFEYEVITGEWAVQQAARAARRAHADDWLTRSPAERDALLEAELPPYRHTLDSLWDAVAATAGLPREEVERRKSAVIEHVQRMAVSIWERRRLAREQELSREKETLVETSLAEVARPIREQREPHVLLHGVDDSVAFVFRKLSEEYPGLRVTDGVSRAYPFESMDVVVNLSTFPASLRARRLITVPVHGVATGIIGWMRDRVFEEDIATRRAATGLDPPDDLGRYLPGDSVGSSGLEKSMERTLRGVRGRESHRLDTGAVERIEPVPGTEVRLTLDVELQARIQAILDPSLGLTVVQDWHSTQLPHGSRLAAGVAVVDIETGDVLALASTPSFTRKELDENPERIYADIALAPSINRAYERPYAPGSIVKPIVLATAVTDGAHHLDQLIACDGHLLPGRNDIYRCWIYRPQFGYTTHSMQVGGPLDGAEAIARSCNIYFYTLGRQLGAERLATMYAELGVGERLRFGLESGAPGFIGRLDDSPMDEPDAIFMGIGQGPVSWTPLHAAAAYATLARGGLVIEPRLVVMDEPRKRTDLKWSREAVSTALEGLRRSANEDRGTGHHLSLPAGRERIFNATGVRIAGKTGTAQSGPIYQDSDHDGSPDRDANGGFIPIRSGDHGWTNVLVGPEGGAYRYAIAVVAEYGGSGSRVAGPIANQVVHALQRLGYLPEGSP